jgi:PAS domain S-box-containing protein
MDQTLRPTGIDVMGDVPWGTHFCNFYHTKDDLLSLQVPYFKAGLENNEYCVWIAAIPTPVEDCIIALREAVPNFDKYLERGGVEIISHNEWYLTNGRLDMDKIIQAAMDRLRIALDLGFEGLRMNGDESWLDRKKWHDFIEYERALNPAIQGKKLIISCDYKLSGCKAADVFDVAVLHECALTMRNGRWEILESPQMKETKAQLSREKELLEKRIADKTRELHQIANEVKKERSAREKAVLSLKRSQSHLKAIVDTADIAFILFDSASNVCLFNPIADYWSRLSFGVHLKKGIYFPELLSKEGKQRFGGIMNKALSGQSVNEEASYPQENGTMEWYQISFNPVKDTNDEVIGVCCSANNITRYKVAESAHDRVSSQLEKRNKDLDKFAYILSHDLRAPLANMIGLAKMLKQGTLPESEKSEMEHFLFQSFEKLDDVVHNLNRILHLEKEESLTKEKINLSELVNKVIARFKPVTMHDNIKISVDFSDANEICSVNSYLESIFYNLISNSLIYRYVGKSPTIEIMSEKQKDKLIIHFKDHKTGKPSKKKTEQVPTYKKLEVSGKNKGIGLYTVKGRVEILGGSIGVSMLPDGGNEFRIELPLK